MKLSLILPLVLDDGNGMLKRFGLTDAQIGQVTVIEKSTRDTVRAEMGRGGMMGPRGWRPGATRDLGLDDGSPENG